MASKTHLNGYFARKFDGDEVRLWAIGTVGNVSLMLG